MFFASINIHEAKLLQSTDIVHNEAVHAAVCHVLCRGKLPYATSTCSIYSTSC